MSVTQSHSIRKTRPGYAWKNHKLYCFSLSDGVLVIQGWPHLRAWRKTPKGKGFFHCRPEVKLGNSPSAGRTRRALKPPVADISTLEGIQPVESLQSLQTAVEELQPGKILTSLGRNSLADLTEAEKEHYEECQRASRRAEDQLRNMRCFLAFAETFPAAIRKTISVFGSRQWSLARLAQLPGGLEMIETNPGLAFAIANSWVFKSNTHPGRTAKRLLRLPRRKAAAWLGFPDSEHSVRMLGTVHPGAGYAHLILNLRRALNGGLDPELMKALAHLPLLNVDALTAINSRLFLRQATPQLLKDISVKSKHPDRLGEWLGLLKDSQRMLLQLGRPNPEPRLYSFKKLRRHHDAVTREYNAHFGDENARCVLDLESPLPLPPLPGTDQVVPLTTVDAFVAEAKAMNHCVLSYALSEKSTVRKGGSHIYHVASSQPATLEISHDSNGGWKVVQLKGRRNAPPSVEAQAIVRDWLKGDRLEYNRGS